MPSTTVPSNNPLADIVAASKARATQTTFRTVLDESGRTKPTGGTPVVRTTDLAIHSTGTRANLTGHLPHLVDSPDGAFKICVAGGVGNYVSMKLFESIPDAHRPPVDFSSAGEEVALLMDEPERVLGTVCLPFLLTTPSGERVRVVLEAHVLQYMAMPMFISHTEGGVDLVSWEKGQAPVFRLGKREEAVIVHGIEGAVRMPY